MKQATPSIWCRSPDADLPRNRTEMNSYANSSQLAFPWFYVMLRKSMITFQSHIQIQRGGEEYRCHPHRYFYIKRVGWFVRTRGEMEISEGVELFDGIIGPFATRAKAKFHLLKLIYQEQPELFSQPPVER